MRRIVQKNSEQKESMGIAFPTLYVVNILAMARSDYTQWSTFDAVDCSKAEKGNFPITLYKCNRLSQATLYLQHSMNKS